MQAQTQIELDTVLAQQYSKLRQAVAAALDSAEDMGDAYALNKSNILELAKLYNLKCYEPLVLNPIASFIIVKTIRQLREEMEARKDEADEATLQGDLNQANQLGAQIEAIKETIQLIIQFCQNDPTGEAAAEHIHEFGLYR